MPAENPATEQGEGLAVLTAFVDGQRVAFPLRHVHEVLPAVETTRIAHAPDVVRGLLNLRGEPLPVLDLRARLGLPQRDADPDDHVLVCRVRERRVGVWVDRADDVGNLPAGPLAPLPEELPTRHIAGAALLEDGLLLVSDVDTFLSPDEMARLDTALADGGRADA